MEVSYLAEVEVVVNAEGHQVRETLGSKVLCWNPQLLVCEGALVNTWREQSRSTSFSMFTQSRSTSFSNFTQSPTVHLPGLRTQDPHEHGRPPGGDLLQEGEHFVYHKPLIQILQNLPQAHQGVDTHLHTWDNYTHTHH